MILVQHTPLSPYQEACKARVLSSMQRQHAIFEFSTLDELRAFLDVTLLQLKALRGVAALTRVVVMFRSFEAVRMVEPHIVDGDRVMAFEAPRCWEEWDRRLAVSGAVDALLKPAPIRRPSWRVRIRRAWEALTS